MRSATTLFALFLLLSSPSESGTGSSTALDPIRVALDEGRAEEAIRDLQELHGRGQVSSESHYLLGLAYQERLDEVGLLSKRRVAGRLRQTLEAALEIDPEHVGAREELADFFFYAPGIVGGSKRRAEEQVDLLASFSPYDGHRVRGRHAYSSEEYREAEGHFSKALALDAGEAALWYQRANARMQRREADAQALQDYERALALGWDDPVAYYQIGRLCVRLGTCAERGEEALVVFIAGSEGRNLAIGHYRLAQLYEQNNRLQESRIQARAAIALDQEIKDAQALLVRVEEKMVVPASKE